MKYILLITVFLFMTFFSCTNPKNENNSNAKLDTLNGNQNSKDKIDSSKQNKKRELLFPLPMTDLDVSNSLLNLYEKPVTKVDTLIEKLLNYKLSDSLTIWKDVENLAKTKNQKAYCFLYITCFQTYIIHHVTPLEGCISFLFKYGKPYEALNKYFFDGKVSTNLPRNQFCAQVSAECNKNLPECFYKEQY